MSAINERVSDKRLVKPEIRDSKYWNGLEFKCDLYHLDMQDFYTYANMLTGADYRELQQYRAAAEPVAFRWRWVDGGEGPGEWWYHDMMHFEAISREPTRECQLVYAAPQVASVSEIASRLVDAYLMNEGGDSEFIACYTISKNDRISEKGKQIWEDWRALSSALKSSQAAPAVQAEQEPVGIVRYVDIGLPDTKGIHATFYTQLPEGTELFSRPAQAEQLFGNTEQVEPGNSPVIPDGYTLVPIELTAENGAKGLLSGEFSETKYINCPDCFGCDECETCDGSGRIEITVPVSWTTIKEIWAKGVKHFTAAPQQEAE